jgi:hypothetical protein
MSDEEFQRTLDKYKTNLIDYKVTGNTGSKTASDTAKAWLDKYVEMMDTEVNKGNAEIKQFVQSYAKSDEDMARMKKEMASIRKDGPELQTLYETEREFQQREEVDYTMYYTKGAVVAGIVGLIAVASMF